MSGHCTRCGEAVCICSKEIELRPEVLAFARLMEERLREKDEDKGSSWKDKTDLSLLVAMIPKFHLLEGSIQRGRNRNTIHAVDLANYCMMIADVEYSGEREQ